MHEGTRQDVFRTVDDWLNDVDAPNVLCISGSPGAGKSAVASSLVSSLTRRRRLGSSFFFKRGDTNLDNPNVLWRTVAFDPSRYCSGMKDSLVEFSKKSHIRDADIKLHF
jgi:ABC-type glutathione transport system ATPase component